MEITWDDSAQLISTDRRLRLPLAGRTFQCDPRMFTVAGTRYMDALGLHVTVDVRVDDQYGPSIRVRLETSDGATAHWTWLSDGWFVPPAFPAGRPSIDVYSRPFEWTTAELRAGLIRCPTWPVAVVRSDTGHVNDRQSFWMDVPSWVAGNGYGFEGCTDWLAVFNPRGLVGRVVAPWCWTDREVGQQIEGADYVVYTDVSSGAEPHATLRLISERAHSACTKVGAIWR